MAESRRSSAVILTLIGVPFAVAAGADLVGSAGVEMRRNLYADRTACERDYSPAQCAQPTGANYSGWYGPYYTADRSTAAARSDPGPGRVGGLATATHVSVRGGFGGFGRAMGAVG